MPRENEARRKAPKRKQSPARAEATAAMLAPRAGDVVIRDLSREEVEEMIIRNRVGRLAFAFHDRVDIQPIHYIYERGWLYGRTSEGEKIYTLKHNQWIAFEIDEVNELFDWRSVVVHGSFWIIHPQGSSRAEELWAKAAKLVAQIVPGALTENDPVSFRHTLFRIAVGDAQGREAVVRPPQAADSRGMEER
jgi:nitroimidazol reductase NimA-like FMN-containing flavoprotein (pyridoxamine 5'-phosphate oxidase superfamily)